MELEKIIECKNLTHYYGDRCIYENLNFTVNKGKITGLLGKNGTGKTTTINILNGFLQPRSGKCLIYNEPSHSLSPETKGRIGLLLEGHVQYHFFNIKQIEKYYSGFFPNWKKDYYYELIKKLQVSETQKISKMSCGQRSQVALGLIMAQDPEVLILDDFSMGLDPGYRRLFIDYLKDYASNDNKTIFVTSHIIQDMENLIDDCIILDYGKVIIQDNPQNLLNNFRCYNFSNYSTKELAKEHFINTETLNNYTETYSFLPEVEAVKLIKETYPLSENITGKKLSLEDAFIGLTGKY